MHNQGGSASLRAGAGLLFIVCLWACALSVPSVYADRAANHTPTMFRADPWHSGMNDDGGTMPDGILKWSYETADRVYSSPAIVDGVVYFGSDDSRIYALDAETGEEVWTYTTGDRVLTSPAVAGGIVYAGSYDNSLYALDKDTGAMLWSFPMESWVTVDPVVVDGVIYCGGLMDPLYAIDAGTGVEIWNTTLGVFPYPSVGSSPAVANGILYVTGNETTLYALDITDGSEIWNFTPGNKISSSTSVADGIVYVSSWDKNVYALNATTGAQIWSYTTGGEGEMASSPAVAYGVVYIGSCDNNLYALDALTGEKIWNYTTGGVVYSSPTYANDVIYVGSWDHRLYALDALTGEKIWDFETGYPIFSSPAVADGTVFFGSLDNRFYAVGSGSGTTNLMLGKLAPAFYENASVMNYTLFYRNSGNLPAVDVVLTDHLPPSVDFVSSTGNPVYDNIARTVTWDLGIVDQNASGSETLTVLIPSSVPWGIILNNTAEIATTTPESRYDDNVASAETLLVERFVPSGTISPAVPGPWGTSSVNWHDQVTFTFNQSFCPPETQPSIVIHIKDGGPDITAPMTGGPQYWYYTTMFYPRYGPAEVTYQTPGCSLSAITFPIYIEATGYIYDVKSGRRIGGAEVYLQRPDEDGNWMNVPTGLVSPPMDPDQNPLVTNSAGQYQWDLAEGTYRVYVEAEGYSPAAGTMVNTPPGLSGMNVGLMPTTGTIWVGSEPTGAEIFLDRGDTGSVTNRKLEGIGPGEHMVGLTLEGYQDFQANVTVIAGETAVIQATLAPLTVEANFTSNETFGLAPMTVLFTDSSTGQGLYYQWDFGDGTANSTEQNPVHTYIVGGTYDVALTVSNNAGSSTLMKEGYITAMEPIPPVGGEKAYYMIHSNVDGAEVYFNGDWYEGTIENGTLLVQTCTSCTPVWSYTIKKCGYFPLTQENHEFPGKDETIHLYANLTAPKEPLIADFSANVTEASAPPLTVLFTSSHIGVAGSWNWSFGDGTYSEEEDPVHTYTALGNYTVSLTLFNSACQNNTMEKVHFIRIRERPPFFADFSVNPGFGPAPMTVRCTDMSTGDPTRIVYDFGDGFKTMGRDATHTYRSPGTYTLTQTIAKFDAVTRSTEKSTATRQVEVIKVIPVGPFAAFSASPVTGSAPLTVTFKDESLGQAAFFIYDTGDNFRAIGREVTYTYRNPGTYTVSLKVMKIDTRTGRIQSDIEIKEDLITVTAGQEPAFPAI